MKRAILTPEEAATWFDAAMAALSKGPDRDRQVWVLGAKRLIRARPSVRRVAIRELQSNAIYNRHFGTRESKRDARILCFCAAVLLASEMTQ